MPEGGGRFVLTGFVFFACDIFAIARRFLGVEHGGGGEEVGQLVVGESGDDRGGHDADGDARLGEGLYRGEPASGPGGSRLHDAAQVVVEGGQRDGYRRGAVLGEL